MTRAFEVEESQYMCPSSKQARWTVKPPWPAGNSQTINKYVKQTYWLWLESNSYRLDSGLQLVVLADALTIWANRPASLTTVHGVCVSSLF